jgi:hypothetical protein
MPREANNPLTVADQIYSGRYGKKFLTAVPYGQLPGSRSKLAMALIPVKHPTKDRFAVGIMLDGNKVAQPINNTSAEDYVRTVQNVQQSRYANNVVIHHIYAL